MKLGIIAPHVPGHLNPSYCLAKALKEESNHDVTIISFPLISQNMIDRMKHSGISFASFGGSGGDDNDDKEMMRQKEMLDELSKLHGLDAWNITIQIYKSMTSIIFRELPKILLRDHKNKNSSNDVSSSAFDALLIDETFSAAISVAQTYRIPYGTICNCLPVLEDPLVPPFITTWKPGHVWDVLTALRNIVTFHFFFHILPRPLHQQHMAYRTKHNLGNFGNNTKAWQDQSIFYVAQIPHFLEFPRQQLPPYFHYTTPWHALTRDDDVTKTMADSTFPFDKLDKTVPIIYASLGTIQNRIQDIFLNLAKACTQLNNYDNDNDTTLQKQQQRRRKVQLVISLGRKGARLEALEQQFATELSNHSIILVDYCPQLQVLPHVSVLVTHAGLNTALEGICAGKPMLAIPLANDQPGVAARWVHAGVAKLVKPENVSVQNLQHAITELLDNPSYQQMAQQLQKRIKTDCPSLANVAKLITVALDPSNQTTTKKYVSDAKNVDNNKTNFNFLRSHPKAIQLLGDPQDLQPRPVPWSVATTITSVVLVAATAVAVVATAGSVGYT